MDTKRKQELDYKQEREVELAKGLPAKTSLMIGRIEIQKWIGQDLIYGRKSLKKWNENDKSSDETKLL